MGHSPSDAWPDLPFAAWSDTAATLHMWLQIAGKMRLALTPRLNHSWQATFYVTSRGLTTSPVPYGERSFEIEFDLIAHEVVILVSDGRRAAFPLQPQSVAAFYRRLHDEMASLGLPVRIYMRPNEVADAVRFDQDETHRAYEPAPVHTFWRMLVQADRLLKQFRAGFIGKCSPVHFFWGAPDLAVTRFSGRLAPQHPGGIPNLPDRITREAYSHEVISAGFWWGGDPVPGPAFYSYAYPAPAGFADARVGPAGAYYEQQLGEFVLPCGVVRRATSPDLAVMEFLESTYDAAATLARWDRAAFTRR